MSKKLILSLMSCAVAAAMALTVCACSAQSASESNQDSQAGQENQVQYTATDEYVSDEVCLSCHGGTYEAVAQLTANYGVQNPHDSIHGGPNSCNNCHDRGSEVTDNMCDNCHAWPRDEASIGLRSAA